MSRNEEGFVLRVYLYSSAVDYAGGKGMLDNVIVTHRIMRQR
jgi:hypothetical protein